MRVLVVGGTGGTGLEVIRQAIQEGIEVTAVVRSQDKLGDLADSITVRVGDVTDSEVIGSALVGCGAVICSVGAPAGFLNRGATDIYSRTAGSLVSALSTSGVSRLVFCTSAGVEAKDPGELLPYKLIAKPFFLQCGYDDMTIAEQIISASGLDWTLVRPARLRDTERTNHFRVSPRFRPSKGTDISRADLASFMLHQIDDQTWLRATPTLAY